VDVGEAAATQLLTRASTWEISAGVTGRLRLKSNLLWDDSHRGVRERKAELVGKCKQSCCENSITLPSRLSSYTDGQKGCTVGYVCAGTSVPSFT
jgi:hypothetical protein